MLSPLTVILAALAWVALLFAVAIWGERGRHRLEGAWPLVYVLSLPDFVGAASKIAQRDGRLVEMYVFVAVVYFVLCYALSFLVKRLQKRVAIIR